MRVRWRSHMTQILKQQDFCCRSMRRWNFRTSIECRCCDLLTWSTINPSINKISSKSEEILMHLTFWLTCMRWRNCMVEQSWSNHDFVVVLCDAETSYSENTTSLSVSSLNFSYNPQIYRLRTFKNEAYCLLTFLFVSTLLHWSSWIRHESGASVFLSLFCRERCVKSISLSRGSRNIVYRCV